MTKLKSSTTKKKKCYLVTLCKSYSEHLTQKKDHSKSPKATYLHPQCNRILLYVFLSNAFIINIIIILFSFIFFQKEMSPYDRGFFINYSKDMIMDLYMVPLMRDWGIFWANIIFYSNVGLVGKGLVPRMIMTPSNPILPFKFQRRQFPLML